jgi:hypothetical protein
MCSLFSSTDLNYKATETCGTNTSNLFAALIIRHFVGTDCGVTCDTFQMPDHLENLMLINTHFLIDGDNGDFCS